MAKRTNKATINSAYVNGIKSNMTGTFINLLQSDVCKYYKIKCDFAKGSKFGMDTRYYDGGFSAFRVQIGRHVNAKIEILTKDGVYLSEVIGDLQLHQIICAVNRHNTEVDIMVQDAIDNLDRYIDQINDFLFGQHDRHYDNGCMTAVINNSCFYTDLVHINNCKPLMSVEDQKKVDRYCKLRDKLEAYARGFDAACNRRKNTDRNMIAVKVS